MEPDGYLEIEFLDHETITYHFKDINTHSGNTRPHGIMIWYFDRYIFHPWSTIRSYSLTFNSGTYQRWYNRQHKDN